MKVKNVMFTGFAAAILGGACGAANAADYTLASQGYVTKQLESKQDILTAGDGIAIEDNVISANVDTLTVQGEDGQPVKIETVLTEVSSAVTSVENKLGDLPEETTVAEALAGKQAVLTNAEVLESITSEDVASIGETADAVETLSGTVGTITNAEGAASTVATEITTLRSGVEAAAGVAESAVAAAGAAQADVNELAGIVNSETNGLGSKVSQAVYDAHLTAQEAVDAKQTSDIKSNTEAINLLGGGEGGAGVASLMQDVADLKTAVDMEAGSVADQIAAAVSEKADAQSVTDLGTTVSGLVQTVAGKQDEITNLNEIEEGAAAGSTALQPGANISELTNNLQYQTATNVADTIAAGKYLTSNGLAAGTYLVSTDGTTVSYKSVEVIDANGDPVQF